MSSALFVVVSSVHSTWSTIVRIEWEHDCLKNVLDGCKNFKKWQLYVLALFHCSFCSGSLIYCLRSLDGDGYVFNGSVLDYHNLPLSPYRQSLCGFFLCPCNSALSSFLNVRLVRVMMFSSCESCLFCGRSPDCSSLFLVSMYQLLGRFILEVAYDLSVCMCSVLRLPL